MLYFKIQRVEWLALFQWFVFLGLCGLSAFYMYNVLAKFLAEETSFNVYEEPIVEIPAITFCFSSPGDGKYSSDTKIYRYGIDFNITVLVWNCLWSGDQVRTLTKGKNVLDNGIYQSIFILGSNHFLF